MVHLSRTFTVAAPTDAVHAFLADFAHAEAWDPGTQRCVREDTGELRVGSTWHNTSKIGPMTTELTYELSHLSSHEIVFTGHNKTATARDRIRLRAASPGHTEITYEATITFNGAARLTDPVMHLVFLRIAGQTVKQMTEVLEARATAA